MRRVTRGVFLVSILTISLISAGAQFSEIGFSSGGVKGGFFSDEATKSSVSNENNSTDSDGDGIPDELDAQPYNFFVGNVIGGGREFSSYHAGDVGSIGTFTSTVLCLNSSIDYPDRLMLYMGHSEDGLESGSDRTGAPEPGCFQDDGSLMKGSTASFSQSSTPLPRGDFNGDGIEDYVLGNANGDCELYYGTNSGEYVGPIVFWSVQDRPTPCVSPDPPPDAAPWGTQIRYFMQRQVYHQDGVLGHSADLDNDGYDDIISIRRWSGCYGSSGCDVSDMANISIFFFDEFGVDEVVSFPILESLYHPTGSGLQGALIETIVSDVDGDGDLDISSWVQYGGFWLIENLWSPDIDGDGIPNDDDAFPEDGTEWVDSDEDGYGDNADAFSDDPLEWADSDGDNIGDNSDVCPNTNPTIGAATLTALSRTAGEANTRVLTLSDGTNTVDFSIDDSLTTSTATKIAFGNANSNANQFATNIAAAVEAANLAGTLNMAVAVSSAYVALTQNETGTAGNTAPSGTAISDGVITLTAGLFLDVNGCDYSQRDSDGDGFYDNSDDYPNDSSRWKDTDNDGIDDNIDTDIDGDGIPNSIENPSFGLSVFSLLLVISLLVIISNDFKS